MQPTDIRNPDYFHKVVDCQWACPAHTAVPEYIRLIAAGRYSDAYMVNWKSNVFPGILGRTCDRPCEPACRRGRVEEENAPKPEPVAICRLKRVTADYKDNQDISARISTHRKTRSNGKKIACVGAGPASLTVARDLAPLGYEVTVFDQDPRAGGMIWSQIPRFRLPLEVIDEEVNYILNLGVSFKQRKIESMKGPDGRGLRRHLRRLGRAARPRPRHPGPQGRREEHPHRHRLAFLGGLRPHLEDRQARNRFGRRQHRDGLLPHFRRLGGDDVKVIVRSGFEEMKASPWEKEDAMHEGIPILNFLVPKTFVVTNGKLTGVTFEKVKAVYDEKKRRSLVPTGEPDQFFECDDVLVAVGQENSFPLDRARRRHRVRQMGFTGFKPSNISATVPNVFFGGDSAFGPKNIIWAVAHGHDAAVSIDKLLNNENIAERPAPGVTLMSQKMGIHEWSYDNEITGDQRYKVPWADIKATLKNVKMEVELGFDIATAWKEAQRCLNCDVQTVFTDKLCIECDACVDICPMDCISFVPNGDGGRSRARA